MRALIERIAHRAGARPEIVELPAAQLEAAGLSVRAASPFSSVWMSLLDTARAVAELGFEHPSLDVYSDSIVASLFAIWPAKPPEGYAQRSGELVLLRRCTTSVAGAPRRPAESRAAGLAGVCPRATASRCRTINHLALL